MKQKEEFIDIGEKIYSQAELVDCLKQFIVSLMLSGYITYEKFDELKSNSEKYTGKGFKYNEFKRDDMIDLIEYIHGNTLITWKDEAGDILDNFLKERGCNNKS